MSDTSTSARLDADVPFSVRHIGPGTSDVARMLAAVGYDSLDDMAQAAVPEAKGERYGNSMAGTFNARLGVGA